MAILVSSCIFRELMHCVGLIPHNRIHSQTLCCCKNETYIEKSQDDKDKGRLIKVVVVELLVNKPSIRMYILMLDTRNEEQTNDVRMYIEEYLF